MRLVDTSAQENDGALRGELAVYVADEVGVGSRTSYFLRDAAGNERKLLFDSTQPEMVTGVRVKLRGYDSPDGFNVTDYELLPDPADAPRTSALIDGTPYAARSFAFILINTGSGFTPVRYMNMSNVAVTPDLINKRMIADADSIKNYYLYDSYGRQDITNVVVGPVTYTPNGCDTSQMANSLRSMVDAQGGPFQHYLWYYGSNNGSCNWSGLASVGSPDKASRDTWYNASVSCVVLVQEPGHNFGMQHSSSLKCGTSPFADDPNSCTASEYGDGFDPMGGGCRHMNAWQKTYQGWFGGCNGVKIQSSGTFTLLPFEPECNGVQFLQVKSPKTRTFNRPAAGGGGATTETFDYYYLELRTPVDFDGTLAYGSSALSPRVLLHVATAPRTRSQTGLHTFLLDMQASTSSFTDAAFTEGQTFTDPGGGLTITAHDIGMSSATIDVKYTNDPGTAPTCLDGTTFTPPGPGTCGMTGTGGTGGGTGTGGAGGSTGTGGRGGTTGAAGASGAAGSGGRGGTTGTAGAGGVTGMAGRGGTTGGGGSATAGAGGSATGMAGRGGATGTAGTGVTTGAAGTGIVTTGAAGSSPTGAAGTGVTTGTAGTGATTGTAGTGMISGAAGTGVTTGAAGNVTSTGSAGTGMVTGNAGAIGPGVGGQGGAGPGEITGGCSCDLASRGPAPGFAVMIALSCIAVGRGRSRRRRLR
jgi:hypothetical protein